MGAATHVFPAPADEMAPGMHGDSRLTTNEPTTARQRLLLRALRSRNYRLFLPALTQARMPLLQHSAASGCAPHAVRLWLRAF